MKNVFLTGLLGYMCPKSISAFKNIENYFTAIRRPVSTFAQHVLQFQLLLLLKLSYMYIFTKIDIICLCLASVCPYRVKDKKRNVSIIFENPHHHNHVPTNVSKKQKKIKRNSITSQEFRWNVHYQQWNSN